MKGNLYILGSAFAFALSVWLMIQGDDVEMFMLMLIAILFNLRAIYFKEVE